MPYGIDTMWLLVGAGALAAGVIVLLLGVMIARAWRGRRDPRLAEINDKPASDGGLLAGNYDALAVDSVADPDVVEMPPPSIKGARLGVIGEVLAMWRRVRKRRKMAKKGYVQWYLIDETFPTPKFVKPELKAGGVPEFKYKGITYLFPKTARLPAEQQGLWTYVHTKGDADPIRLSEPLEYAIKGDELSDYLAKRVTSSPPGLLDRFDIDLSPQQIMAAGIVAIVLFAVFGRFFGG